VKQQRRSWRRTLFGECLDKDTTAAAGIDPVNAGSGDDLVEAHEDAGKDTIDCGDGIDLVRFDAGVDVVADNCENRDPH
jgi:hypothetical protein